MIRYFEGIAERRLTDLSKILAIHSWIYPIELNLLTCTYCYHGLILVPKHVGPKNISRWVPKIVPKKVP